MVFKRTERKQKLQKISTELGLSYAETISQFPQYIQNAEFLTFREFQLSKNQPLSYFQNIITGQFKGIHLFLCDFTKDYSNSEIIDYKQTIAVLKSSKVCFPKFYLMPRGVERFTIKFDHLGQDFIGPLIEGYRKIPFEQHPECSKKYILKSPELASAGELFSLSLMHYLYEHPGWFIEGCKNVLLIYRRGKKINPNDISKFIGDVIEIYSLFTSKHS